MDKKDAQAYIDKFKAPPPDLPKQSVEYLIQWYIDAYELFLRYADDPAERMKHVEHLSDMVKIFQKAEKKRIENDQL